MTDPLAEFSARIGKMTPGEWRVDPSSGVDVIFNGRELVAHATTRNFEHDAAGICLSLRLARLLGAEETVEKVARALCRADIDYYKQQGIGDWTDEQRQEAVDADWSYFAPEARAALNALARMALEGSDD
jgi:hypothetical protein